MYPLVLILRGNVQGYKSFKLKHKQNNNDQRNGTTITLHITLSDNQLSPVSHDVPPRFEIQ